MAVAGKRWIEEVVDDGWWGYLNWKCGEKLLELKLDWEIPVECRSVVRADTCRGFKWIVR